jgi:site-specific DNA-methyltransferase (adenine-specific)
MRHAIHAAQKLGRKWIGIDITYLAINLIKRRLRDAFGEEIEFEEKGQPTDFGGAKQLAENDKFQFQHWALSLIGARPLKEGDGKGADRGVDGTSVFLRDRKKRSDKPH